MRWITFISLACGFACQLQAQWTDSFLYLDTNWVGSRDLFIIDGQERLQLNAPSGGQAWLFRPAPMGDSAVFSLEVWLDFAPSASNLLEIYLVAYAASPGAHGLLLRVGESGSEDALELVQRDQEGDKVLARGQAASWASNPLYEVTAEFTDGHLSVWLDKDTAQTPDMACPFPASNAGTFYAGIHCQYSSTRKDKFRFDNVQWVGQPDSLPPELLEMTEGPALYFSEPIAETANSLANNQGQPQEHQFDSLDRRRLWFSPDSSFTLGVADSLKALGIHDLVGNGMDTSIRVDFRPPQRGEVLISEVLIDPTPSLGLPEAEFIELHNIGQRDLNLAKFRLVIDEDTLALPPLGLPVDSFVLLVADTAPWFGYPVIVVPGLSLRNDSSTIQLWAGTVLDSLGYRDTWNLQPEDGRSWERLGWSEFCTGEQTWQHATQPLGGTPGADNGLDAHTAQIPTIKSYAFVATRQILVQLSPDWCPSLQGAAVHLSPGDIPADVQHTDSGLLVTLPIDPTKGQYWTLRLSGIKNCFGYMAPEQTLSWLHGFPPQKGEICINEILFNPKTGGVDFLELKHLGGRLLQLADVQIEEWNAIGTTKLDSAYLDELLLAPGELIAFTSDSFQTEVDYPGSGTYRIQPLPNLPNWPDDSGQVRVSFGGQVLDSARYASDWHFNLLQDRNGVSLERRNQEGDGMDSINWFSAASTAGFATPGRENSQHSPWAAPEAELTLTPMVFSPNHDGYDDLLQIQLKLPEPGYVGDCLVFDDLGLLVRRLEVQALFAASETWIWDGLDELGVRQGNGRYIIAVDAIKPGHRPLRRKAVCVLVI